MQFLAHAETEMMEEAAYGMIGQNLGWTSPIGIGFFLVALALTIYLLTLTDKNNKKK